MSESWAGFWFGLSIGAILTVGIIALRIPNPTWRDTPARAGDSCKVQERVCEPEYRLVCGGDKP